MEHIALYRQFRPSNFDEIVEQKAAVTALRQSVLTGRLGHAYLFCGQRGTGKTSIARVFSRAINCENPVNGNPCNTCLTCKGILDGSLMDVIEIDAASNNSVANVRKICEEVNFAPSVAPHKVYIIDEVHMITNDAFNALLKTLEEPPSHAVFLFATTEPHRIPATILSRCQRYEFRRITPEAIVSRLRYICEKENINADTEALRLIASLSDGAMRDAISVLDQAASSADGKLITPKYIEDLTGTVDMRFVSDLAEVLIEGKFDELMSLTAQLADSGRDIIHFSLDLAEYFRNLLIVRTVPNPTSLIQTSPENLKRMYEVARLTGAETIVAFISAISKMISDLKWSPSVRTSFEIYLIRLCGRKVKTDVVPLTIPDFAEKQAEAAKTISAAVPAIEPAKIEETKPVEAVIPEEKKTEPAPVAEQVSPAPAEPELPVAPPVPVIDEPVPVSVPVAPLSPDPLDSLLNMGTEPVSAPAEPEIDPEDIPLENQMDLFSMAAAPAEPEPAPAPAVAPVVPEPAPAVNSDNILAGLSDNFLDDIQIAASPVHKPTGRNGETVKSALSLAVEETPIAVAKPQVQPEPEPENKTPEQIWADIISEVEAVDFTLGPILKGAEFKYEVEDVYIIFGDDKMPMIQSLKGDANFRSISPEIKRRIAGVVHVYLSTSSQYAAAHKKAAQPAVPSGNVVFGEGVSSGAQALLGRSKDLGINTEFHFGDN